MQKIFVLLIVGVLYSSTTAWCMENKEKDPNQQHVSAEQFAHIIKESIARIALLNAQKDKTAVPSYISLNSLPEALQKEIIQHNANHQKPL